MQIFAGGSYNYGVRGVKVTLKESMYRRPESKGVYYFSSVLLLKFLNKLRMTLVKNSNKLKL